MLTAVIILFAIATLLILFWVMYDADEVGVHINFDIPTPALSIIIFVVGVVLLILRVV